MQEGLEKKLELKIGETATEKQLQLRNQIHENIALLSDIIRDKETLYSVSIKKAKESFGEMISINPSKTKPLPIKKQNTLF